VEFSRSGQEKHNKAGSGEEKLGKFEMTFTGTLIEDLMATVERAELRAADRAQVDGTSVLEPVLEPLAVEAVFVEPIFVEPTSVEAWFASVSENADYDSKFLGVA
jgi:hypothetical protein